MLVSAGDELFIVYPPEDTSTQTRESKIEGSIIHFGCVLEPRPVDMERHLLDNDERPPSSSLVSSNQVL